jgi:opacity protein-like surface antigen
MKKRQSILFALAFTTSVLFAGGKGVAVVETPVEPLPVALATPSPIYLGLGLVGGQYSGSTCNGCQYEDITYGAMLRAGVDFNQYFGIEARALGTFLQADELGGQKLSHVGLFAKPMVPLGDEANIYGLIGYGYTQTSFENRTRALAGGLAEYDNSGLSGGVGIELDFSNKEADREEGMYPDGFDGHGDQERGWGAFLDYQRLLIDSDAPDMDVVSAGVTYDF